MKLNLGAGDDRRDGYISVDLRPEVADVCSGVEDLPFDDGEATEILALDILEHLPPNRTLAALMEWRRVLAPGGTLILRVPNMYQLARALAHRYETGVHASVNVLMANIYGGHRWGPDGCLDAHEWGWTPYSIVKLLEEAGFAVLSNSLELNMVVEAKRV